MIPSAVSSFFHTFLIFYFRHLCTCFNVSVKHSRWNIQTDGTKASETFFSLVFVASASPSCYMFKVSATRIAKQSCSESMQTPSAAAHAAICFIFCGEGSAKTVKNNNQPTTTTLRLTHLPLRSSAARVWIWATIPSTFLQLYSDGNRLIEQALWAGNGRHPRDCMFSHRD